MKKILITGSRGFIGSRIIDRYRHDFQILSTNSDNMNILDENKVFETITSFNPDYVIHCAAVAVTDYCNRHPYKCHAVNVDGTVNIAKACAETGSRMVFLSTEQVFNGNSEPGPYCEDDKPQPDTVYGKNKLEAEQKIIELCNNYLILRLTWMFGIPDRFQPVSGNILWDTIKMILKGTPFNVPVHEYRGLTYINELIDQFPEILKLPNGTYHTGSENSLSRYDVVCQIFKDLGLEHRISELLIKDEEKYKSHNRDARLDTSLIKSTGIKFLKTIDAIKLCIKENNLAL